MKRLVVGLVTVTLIGAAGCGGGGSNSDAGTGGHGGAGTGGVAGHASGGSVGSGGAAGAGSGGKVDAGTDLPAAGGMTGSGGSGDGGATGSGGSIVDAGLVPATCSGTINGMLKSTDSVQIGRESRVTPTAVCGTPKAYPTNGADPSNPHFYNAYHFVNPSGDPACFNFTLTYDSGSVDGSTGVARYLTAYSSYDPTNIGSNYLGDVGAVLTSPQTMGITVPAGSSIDVVVFAIDVAPNGTGAYTLSCTTGSADAGTGGADGGGGAGGNDGGAGGASGADGGGTDGSDGSGDAAPDVAPDA